MSIRDITLSCLLCFFAFIATKAQQVETSCNPSAELPITNGTINLNYGSVTNAFNVTNKQSFTIGQPMVFKVQSQKQNIVTGFWSRLALPPSPPALMASQGDFPDRIQLMWDIDPLSAPVNNGFIILRDGAFLAEVDSDTRQFIDFNVQAGEFYTYGVQGRNTFGSGRPGNSVGFVNPNGVVTGQVTTQAGNPVSGAVVTLSPTIGTSLQFAGEDYLCVDYHNVLDSKMLSASAWVKIDEGYDSDGIIDLGSDLKQNWWIHTTPASAGKGLVVGVGDSTQVYELSYEFEEDPDDWHYVAFTYGGGTLLLYVDGVFIGSLACDMDTRPAAFKIGARRDETGFFKGKIDDVRIFDDLLSQSDIILTSNITVSRNTPNLVAYWKFDEGLGTKVFDLSENGMDAFIYGPVFSSETPAIENAGITDDAGFYAVEGINYSKVQSFTARPRKSFYDNYAIEFNSARESYVQLADFPLADSATVEVLVYPFDVDSRQSVLTKLNGASPGFDLYIEAGKLHLEINGESKELGSASMGYKHIALTFDVGSNQLVYHLNGEIVQTLTYSDLSGDWSGNPWVIGALGAQPDGQNFFTGLVDEVAFYNDILDLPRIQLNASQFGTGGTDVSNAALFAYYSLNEGEGTEVLDFGAGMSGSGSLVNGVYSIITFKQETAPHLFLPSTKKVNINTSNTAVGNIDFSDVSTIAISGVVRFENTFCFAEGVEILVNGASHVPPIFTDVEGRWSGDFDPGASVVLTPKFEDHTFLPGFFEMRRLNTPVAGVLFQNQTKRKVVGQIAGGDCRKSVITPGAIVKISARALNGCFEKEILIENTDGKYEISGIPPVPYAVVVKEHSNNVIKEFFQNLGGTEIDLTKIESDTVDFIYKSAPEVEISALPLNDCGFSTLVQGVTYTNKIKVFETYDGGKCYLDEAALTIDNSIADLDQYSLQMQGGEATIKYMAGLPILAEPYMKNLQVTAMVDGSTGSSVVEAAVLGKRPRTTTFQSKSPSIPFLILRDPPGDGSYSYIESGTTTCQSFSVDVSAGGGGGTSVKTSLGADLTTSVGIGAETELKVETTADIGLETTFNYTAGTTNEAEMCVTINKRYETSQLDDRVGSSQGGDLFVGTAINFIYGLTDDLEYDTDSCKFNFSNSITVYPGGFETDFAFTQHQIEGVIIPELTNLGETESVEQWQKILQMNEDQKKNAVFKRNISFDAGPVYEESQETSVANSTTFSYDTEYSAEMAATFGVKVNGVGVEAGIKTSFSYSKSEAATQSNTDTKTVGFVLTDDDANDNFTVNILEDKNYGTPVFELVSGQSMCPWEKGTQNREEVSLVIDKKIANNVASNAPAVFKVTLANISQSAQTMNYILAIPPGYNPDGAQIEIVGANFETPIQLQPFESKVFTVTVERGPEEYTYTDLRIAAYSECEYDRALGLGNDPNDYDEEVFNDNPFYKEVSIDVYFIEPCSEVDIAMPSNNVVTTSSGDNFYLTVNSYNKNDSDLELIRVQYRPKEGDGAWINIAEIAKADLGAVFEIVEWNTAELKDGMYEVRAITSCTSVSLAPGVSTLIPVRIERKAPELFGTPQPADGVLSPGDEISIQFTKRINCNEIFQADGIGTNINNNNLGVYFASSGALVDATITCNEDKITIVPNILNRFIENQTLRVQVEGIKDLVGSELEDPVVWEFYVNRSTLYWAGGAIEEVTQEGNRLEITREIRNQGGISMEYNIDDIPEWMEIFPSQGTLDPGTSKIVTISFPADLITGDYSTTINMTTAEGEEPLEVALRVACEGPDWQVLASDYTNSMNLTLELDIEGTLSTDRLDRVGAFVGGELRGVANIQYVSSLDKYLAFLTVYSNEVVGETVSFRIWDARECLLYGSTMETFDFVADDLIGSPVVPETIHTNNLLLRTIPIYPGWNWISYNVQLPDPSINTALGSLTNPQNGRIKSQTQFSQYLNGSNSWVGTLQNLSHLTMYQYRSSSFDSLVMVGMPINPATTSLNLRAGWNWISYLPQQGQSTTNALSSLTPLQGDIVKGQGTFAQYVAGVGWVGNLTYMSPLNGYQIKLTNADVLTYPVPSGSSLEEEIVYYQSTQTDSALWVVDPAEYEMSMNVILKVTDDEGKNMLAGYDELGAFVNGQVRGSGKPIFVDVMDSYLVFLTIYSNEEGEQISFKLYDESTGETKAIREELVFIANRIIGEVELPYKMTLANLATSTKEWSAFDEKIRIYPNPSIGKITLSYQSDKVADYRMVVRDILGNNIYVAKGTTQVGENLIEWNGFDQPAGVYLVSFESEGALSMHKIRLIR